MRNFFVLVILFCTSIGCVDALAIRLDINIVELAEKDIKDYGIEHGTLHELLTKRFAEANITIKEDPDLPKFTLQIKSLPSVLTIATFLQGSFYEEATIAQTKKTIWAITWSQIGILTGSKELYKKNVQDESLNIVNSFISDFQQRAVP